MTTDHSPWRRTIAVVFALAIVAILLALPRGRRDASTREIPADAFRVGLVFDVGGRGDKSFNDAAYAGLRRAEDELREGRPIVTELLEPRDAEDRESALRLFAARRFDLVIAVGFIFSRDVDVVARDAPATRFACVDYAPPFDGSPIPANVTGLAFREEEGSFLVGALAGLVTKRAHVGFVGGMDIPLIHKFEAGYRTGVAATCPTCAIEITYAGSTPDAFRDPAKGKSIALAQIGAGADVLYHAAGSTGHGVFEAARESGVPAIGVDSDQYDEAPGTVITSMVKRADVAVFDAIESARRGALRQGMLVLGLKEHGVEYVHEGAHGALLDAELIAKVEGWRGKIVAGEVRVPTE